MKVKGLAWNQREQKSQDFDLLDQQQQQQREPTNLLRRLTVHGQDEHRQSVTDRKHVAAFARACACIRAVRELTSRCGVDAAHQPRGPLPAASPRLASAFTVRGTHRGDPERSILRLQPGHVTFPEEERDEPKPDANTATGADGGRRWGGEGGGGDERWGQRSGGGTLGVSNSIHTRAKMSNLDKIGDDLGG